MTPEFDITQRYENLKYKNLCDIMFYIDIYSKQSIIVSEMEDIISDSQNPYTVILIK
jgi:hypothetical protein